MDIKYYPSLTSDLARIIKEYGNDVGTLITEEISEINQFLDSIKSSELFFVEVKDNFDVSKFHPSVYYDKGMNNCNNLFFQKKSNIKGGIAYIRFYIPSMFITNEQKEEMFQFTKNGKERALSNDSVEFYSIVYFEADSY
jgi:hypothetical protein